MQNTYPQPIERIERGSKAYPERLNDLHDPPKILYIKGNSFLLRMPMIAIVGSRNATNGGLRHAIHFAQALSKAGFLVISGMASGIDGAAHKGALSLGPDHFTLAICGTGLDQAYPREHVGLAHHISKQGLLLSEFSPGIGPKPFHFPRRNRLIAALALGVVVIEAAERSGSLITARLAADLGREVFALPGPPDLPNSLGCHRLIQEGAKLVCSPKEVLEELVI